MGPELDSAEAVARILLVMVLAGAVGIERELREQEAGLRTHMLVGVGAALFVIAGNFAWEDLAFGNQAGIVLDPSRVVAYVVTGVGFLGAGAILKHGASIRGLTTAASLWVVAAIGVVGGAGEYGLAVFATAVVLLSLWPVKQIARLLGLRRGGSKRLVVLLERDSSIGAVFDLVDESGLEVQTTTVGEEVDGRRLEVLLSGREHELRDALDGLGRLPGVRSASVSA